MKGIEIFLKKKMKKQNERKKNMIVIDFKTFLSMKNKGWVIIAKTFVNVKKFIKNNNNSQ